MKKNVLIIASLLVMLTACGHIDHPVENAIVTSLPTVMTTESTETTGEYVETSFTVFQTPEETPVPTEIPNVELIAEVDFPFPI